MLIAMKIALCCASAIMFGFSFRNEYSLRHNINNSLIKHIDFFCKNTCILYYLGKNWGFGPDAHVAEFDILHTIHCLNAIRRDVHWLHYIKDRYPDGVFPELHRTHTDHCIYIVLQNLMCGATADIVTQPWVSGQLHPFPDFAVNKKCRNFDAILEWHEAHMITDMEKFKALRMLEGHVPYYMSDEFNRMFGVGEEDMFHENHDGHETHGSHSQHSGQHGGQHNDHAQHGGPWQKI